MIKLRLDINLTYECNAVCKWCDRMIGVMKIDDSHVTPDQLTRMRECLTQQGMGLKRIKLTGGEPMMNPQFTECVKQCQSMCDSLMVCTNCILPQIDFAKPIFWKHSPAVTKNHAPFLVSPKDIGIRGDGRCKVQKQCGYGFDAFGFAMCSVAGVLGRLFGIDPYSNRPVLTQNKTICQHCLYSLPRWTLRAVKHSIEVKDIVHPTPTYRALLKQWRDDNVVYPRY